MKLRFGCLIGVVTVTAISIGGALARYYWAIQTPVIHIPAPLPTPSPNGFDLYVMAARSISFPNPPLEPIYDPAADNFTPTQKAQRYSPARRANWVRQNAPGFALFERARTAESRLASTRNITRNPISSFRDLKWLARYKVSESKAFEGEGKWREAVEARLEILEMASDISRGGSLIASLMAIACEATALNGFENLIPHLTARDCREFNTWLEKWWTTRPLFSESLTEEKYSYDQMFLDQWAAADKTKNKTAYLGPGKASLWLVWSRRGTMSGFNKLIDAFIAQADKPLHSRHPVMPSNQYLYPYNYVIYPLLERGLFSSTRSLAGPQSQQLRLALRAYRLEQGTYPLTLSQLAPKYLSKLPVDPYGGGETWHYRREEDSYRAWSVGPDGKDDGGKPILPKGHNSRVIIWTDSLGDVVVRP